MQPKATLEDKFNDDYEPVRCQVLGGVVHEAPRYANIICEEY